ncbi:MAG: hypothetical protein ACRDQF_19350 [Thermocrispum sp.]
METLYTEGVATHGGPESCGDVREGVGEALTGVRAGWAMEPRNHDSRVLTLSNGAEGNTVSSASRELLGDPARSENLCMYGAFMCENREVPWPPVAMVAAGRLENTKVVRPG